MRAGNKGGGRRSEGGRKSMDTGMRIGRGHGGAAPGAVVSAHWSVVVRQ